jgi:thymidylate synthase
VDKPYLFPVTVAAEHLDDAYWKTMRECFTFGHEYEVTHGSYEGQMRYEFDYVTVVVKRPGEQIVPVMPEGCSVPPPASREQIETYMAEYLYMDAKSEKEDYRYGERLVNPKLRGAQRPDLKKSHMKSGLDVCREEMDNLVVTQALPGDAVWFHVNQIDEVIRMFKEGGHGTNQACMEIAMPNDVLLQDPPCLRLIDCRVRYGALHFVVYFRSWDLFAGFPVNLGGLELLKQMMADEIGVKNGCMIAGSKGLHIYEQYYPLVEALVQMPLAALRRKGAEAMKIIMNA